jgi:hypothetical protein
MEQVPLAIWVVVIRNSFSVLNLQYAKDVQCSVGSVYVDEFKRGYFPESCPPSSHVTLTFPKQIKQMVMLLCIGWMVFSQNVLLS